MGFAVIALLLPASTAVATIVNAQGRALNATAGQAFTDVVATFEGDSPGGYSASIDWGDGSAATDATIQQRSQNGNFFSYDLGGGHTYAQPGDYKIVVTVTDPASPNTPQQIQAGAHVVAPQEPPPGEQPPAPQPQPQNEPPIAQIAAEASTIKAGAPLAFDASKSTDSDGSIIAYAFDLDGNGSFETDCGSSPSAVGSYGTSGTVRVGVRVTDSAGAASVTTATLAITGKAPTKGTGASAPSGITLGFCRPPELAGRPGIDLTDSSCLRTVATRIAEAVAAGCFEVTGEDPAKASSSVLPTPPPITTLIEQHYYVASGRIKLNGLDIKPSSGAKLVVHKEAARLYTLGSGATVSLNAGVLGVPAIPLKTGKLDWKFPLKGNKLRIADFSVAPAAALFGFNIDGTAAVDLAGDKTGGPRAEVPVHLGLPGVFKDPTTGKGLTADVTLKADNERKLYLDALRVDLPHAFLGGLEINDLFFEYRKEESIWRGGAELIFPSGHKLDAVPPPSTQGIGFRDGGLEYAGAELTFPDPGVPVFSSVYLHRIGFTLETHPTRFTGTAQLTAGSAAGKTLASIDGTVFVVFATPEEPFDIRGKHATALGVDVSGKLTMLDTVPLAEAHVMYLYPYYIEAGGKLEYHIIKDRLFARASAGGWVDLGSGQFNIEAGADLCIDIKVYSGCRGGSVVLSSRGMGGCVSLWFADVGGGIYWSGGGKIFFRSCDIGPFRATLSRASADGSFTVSVGRDAPFEAFEVVGRDTAPNVQLSGPGGKQITTPESGFLDTAEAAIWRGSGDDKSTWVLLPRAAAGSWEISAAEGSAIASVRSAHGLAEPSVRARVTGKGRKRALAYSVKPLPGQVVRFVERGPQTAHVLGTARAANGRLPFRIADGPAGKRTVVAVVENEGTVREEITVARFRAPRPAVPAKPRRLHVKRTRGGLTLRWKRVPDVNRYVIGVDVSDGRRLAVTSRKPSMRIPQIPAEASARIRVAGLTATNTTGKRATVRVAKAARRRAS
jgi:PKD domain